VKAVTPSKIVLESIGLRDRPESLIRELYAAAGPLHAEAAPAQPRQPLEQALAFARGLPGACDGATIVARDDAGQIVGSADVTVQDMDGFRHVAQVSIGVLPGHRRAGIGRALLGGVLEVAGRLGRSLLMGDTRETVPAGGGICPPDRSRTGSGRHRKSAGPACGRPGPAPFLGRSRAGPGSRISP
jgi:GNAT superfamily N-acetyltransferase